MLSGNSLKQTVHTHRASVHQAAKLVAALLRVARATASLVAAVRRVYDSCSGAARGGGGGKLPPMGGRPKIM